MPNIAEALKAEIGRVARKELREELETLRKTSARYRAEIAELKRRLAALEKQSKRLAHTTISPKQDTDDEPDGPRLRFRAAGFASLREKLGISAESMGKLIGVSGQSVYKWEAGKATPRRSQLPVIAEVRKLGKRRVAARLEELA